MTEWMLEGKANSFASVHGDATQSQARFRYVALRYFNVAGASQNGPSGQPPPNALRHPIKVACKATFGNRGSISIYGTDYPIPEETCIPDYIHVEDLAQAYLLAPPSLWAGGSSETLNCCGYGTGFSVRKILDAVEEVVAYNSESLRRSGERATRPLPSRILHASKNYLHRDRKHRISI